VLPVLLLVLLLPLLLLLADDEAKTPLPQPLPLQPMTGREWARGPDGDDENETSPVVTPRPWAAPSLKGDWGPCHQYCVWTAPLSVAAGWMPRER